ncbi:MAG: glycosyltransferase family 39 protein [Proteobacteria bacterium]|nr:glycosyltransferase family 39 protein [Pseudomonadota bacterium]
MELRRVLDPGLARPVILAAAVVAAATVIRLWVAANLKLAPDETYYWIWSQALAPGYLDHPPMVALWIAAGTDLTGVTPLGVRLLGPLSAALASGLLFDAGRCLFPGTRAGTIAVVMLNATLVLGAGAVIMTPDAPLLAFWIAALWAMARLLASGRGVWWLVAGVFAGLASLSKYTAVFLWIGIGLWAVLVPTGRVWLRRWQPWAGLGAGALLFVPVLAWNAAHDWVGLLKQGGRVGTWQPARAAQFLGELIGAQVGFATPWIFILCMIGLVVAIRRIRDTRWALLAALSVPPVLVFLQHAIGDRVQGNWPAIIYPALVLAAAGWLVARGRRDWIGASVLGFAITAVVYLQAVFGLIPLPLKVDPIALRLGGWDGIARDMEAARVATSATFIAADGYDTDSELAWHLPAGVTVVGVDPRWALFRLPPASIGGQVGVLLRDSGRSEPPDPATWAEAVKIGALVRPGAPREYNVYRVVAAARPPVAVRLPHRH